MVGRVGLLPLPFVSAWDPRAGSAGSIDPLGALRPFTAAATTLFPGVTTITTRVRYLSWVCAGLRLLDEVGDAPVGGQAGRARRQRLLAWERILGLATGIYGKAEGLAEDDGAWRQLRGISYVRRALTEGARSPKFLMLRNQAGIGCVGTYWVTLVAGGLVEESSAALTSRGADLADAFLRMPSLPERELLLAVLRGDDVEFAEKELIRWGKRAHLGAASEPECRLLGDALLEPAAHRRMAAAMRATGANASDGEAFELLRVSLLGDKDPLSERLAAVLAVAGAFERLHLELLYRFDQIRAAGHRAPVPVKGIRLVAGRSSIAELLLGLETALNANIATLPATVAEAARGFAFAIQPAARAQSDAELIDALVRHHERVQAGKLDASRQPKLPWVELRGRDVVVSPRFALDELPEEPSSGTLTHPYRIANFAGMLQEAGVWEAPS